MRHLCAVLLLCAVLFAASCAQNAEGPWVTSWATSLYEPGPAMGEPEALGDRTIRNAVTATVGGKKARRRVSAEEMTAEYAALAGRAHAEGLHILIGTIPPFGAFPIWTQEIEAERQEVNDWIRANSEFDGRCGFRRGARRSCGQNAPRAGVRQRRRTPPQRRGSRGNGERRRPSGPLQRRQAMRSWLLTLTAGRALYATRRRPYLRPAARRVRTTFPGAVSH